MRSIQKQTPLRTMFNSTRTLDRTLCHFVIGPTEAKQTERMLWTNHAAFWLKSSSHITSTLQRINLNRSHCKLKFKVPCHFQLQVLMDERNVSLSCTKIEGQASVCHQYLCCSLALVLKAVSKKQPAFDKHIYTALKNDQRWDMSTVRRNLKRFERFLGAKTKNAFQTWLKGTFWDEYLWNCTSNVYM